MLCATNATGTASARIRIVTTMIAASHDLPPRRSRRWTNTGQVEKQITPAKRIAPMKGCRMRKQPTTSSAAAAMRAICSKRDWRPGEELPRRLRGKHKPESPPHVATGAHIVVVNVEKLRVPGPKGTDKNYYRHSTYPGGIYETNFTKLQARHPDRVLKLAVKGMLPKGRLGYAMIKKLKIYAGPAHPHASQQPKTLEI